MIQRTSCVRQRTLMPEDIKPTDLIGQKLAGRYELMEVLDEGGNGLVYRALQWPLRRSVAVKVLTAEAASNPKRLRRFVHEARILCRLRHPNIVNLIDFGKTDDGVLFLVIAYVAGGSLRNLMKSGRLTVVPALDIARQLARGLAEAHAHSVIHRDLKPENVLIDDTRTQDRLCRIIDFGLAKRTDDTDEVTTPRTRLGTPAYMPPEQAFYRPVDPTADLYSLGVILFEMLTGHAPFEAGCNHSMYLEHQYSQVPKVADFVECEIPQEVEDLIANLLSKTASERPQSALDVAKKCTKIIEELEPHEEVHLPVSQRPVHTTVELPHETHWRANRYVLRGALLGGTLVALVAVLVSVWN